MKKQNLTILIVYILLLVCGRGWAVGEKTIVLGGSATWSSAEFRTGITEAGSIRPYPALVLSSAANFSSAGYLAASGAMGNFLPLAEAALDLSISFDERNPGLYHDSAARYKVTALPGVEARDRHFARAGTGAALFNGTTPVVIEPQNRNALFAPGNRIGDFTIEFWLHPMNLENGERVLSWSASRTENPAINPYGGDDYSVQRIQCTASKNRLDWSFINFFTSTDGASCINIEFSGVTPVVPKIWSHHLVRFDSVTGMIEYIVDGESEAIVYAVSRERGRNEIHTPVTGGNGFFLLGERFMGLIDEFKIHSVCAGKRTLQKYASAGGRMQTSVIDLGSASSSLVRVNVTGGRIGARNEYRENGRFRFTDDAEINFFVRSSGDIMSLSRSPWKSFTPGLDLTGISGRYVQIAADFYPSADGETSPYLDEVRLVYLAGGSPLPPRNVTAMAVDNGVLLRWKHSPNASTAGYLIYYSAVRGEFFGEGAFLGRSPIDAGYRDSILIDGLDNGALYYFRIASYDRNVEANVYNVAASSGTASSVHAYSVGEFSAEVTARPLAGLSLLEISRQLEDR